MPIGFPLALPLGGGPDDVEVAQEALLQALTPGLDPEGPAQVAQTYGEALAIANVWAVNRRLTGQLDPGRMIETLPAWETASELRPAPTALDGDRRAVLSAQFLGYVGNAIGQLYDVCVALAGSLFLGFFTAPPTAATSYLQGVNPGPPGAEHASHRAHLAVRLSRGGLPDAAFFDLVRQLRLRLTAIAPAWMTFAIGTFEGGAVPGVAIPGVTLL